ncbi:MAG: hypothetical protein CL992_00890 [Euryarchaeota archaeon]|nr:hypothetical protein [Euryarchaeota archaeon]
MTDYTMLNRGAEMSDPLLVLNNLSVGYGEKLVTGIHLEVRSGEVIAILGPSGSGKTTLLRTIAGLVRPLSGKITRNFPKRGGLGYIPQRLGLVRHGSVGHNVDLGAMVGTPRNLSWWSERRSRVKQALESVGISEKLHEPVRRLSGGQQRRVATARALAQKPTLILADEFLGELDQVNVSVVIEAVQSLIDTGSSMIMVEHIEDRAIEFSTRVFRIQEGYLIEEV